jgi:hypothetical protein
MVKTLLWLDDVRDPLTDDWLVFSPIGRNVDVHWVTSYQEFVDWITIYGLPDAICFDHDLGKEIEIAGIAEGMSKRQARKLKQGISNGYDCACWLVEYCQKNNKPIPPYGIQSANSIGRERIDNLLKQHKI